VERGWEKEKEEQRDEGEGGKEKVKMA